MEDIAQLTEVDGSLDSRLSELEVDGTFAFHVELGIYSTIPFDSVVVYPTVNLNLGGGYNAATGQFTTPSGGAGLYCFFAHFSLGFARFAWMNIRRNSNTVAIMNEDAGETVNSPGSSCGTVMQLEEGKRSPKKLYNSVHQVMKKCSEITPLLNYLKVIFSFCLSAQPGNRVMG